VCVVRAGTGRLNQADPHTDSTSTFRPNLDLELLETVRERTQVERPVAASSCLCVVCRADLTRRVPGSGWLLGDSGETEEEETKCKTRRQPLLSLCFSLLHSPVGRDLSSPNICRSDQCEVPRWVRGMSLGPERRRWCRPGGTSRPLRGNKRAVLELLTRREGRGVCLRETLERERQPRRSSPHETSRSGIAYAAGMGLQGDGALPSGQRLGFGEL
jgi:hypothetical protein